MPVVSRMAWRFYSWLKCVCISIGLLKVFTSGHAHGLYHEILNIHGLHPNGRSPMKAITFPERFWATNKSLYFNIEWNIFNVASPFTIPTNTWKFSDSAACILNVAHFVDFSPTSACHLSSFLDNSCVIAVGPNILTASISADHPVSPPCTFLLPCC